MTGVAHKVEIEPPQLGFGLLLLSDDPEDNSPTYKEQKLTVKNQGVTTVSLTVSTTEPFSVMSGSSFTLPASEAQEVTVRFDAPAPGKFEGSVRLAAGQLNVEIPAKASVMNEEDFLQLLAELSQIQELDTVIPTNGIADVGLLGFKDLTVPELQALLELARTQDWGSVIPEQTGNPIVDFIISYILGKTLDLLLQPPSTFSIAEVTVALQTLARSLANGTFDADYKSFTSQSSFGQFVNAMTSILNQMGSRGSAAFGAADASGAVRNIMANVADLYRKSDSAMQDRITTVIINFGPAGTFLLGGLIFADPGGQAGLVNLVVNNLNDILRSVGNDPWYYTNSMLWRQITQAMIILGAMKAYADQPEVQRQVPEILQALVIAGNMARDRGWEIYGFRAKACNVPDCSFQKPDTYKVTKVDVIAATTLSTGKQVNIFAQFFHAVTGYSNADLQTLVHYLVAYGSVSVAKRAGELIHQFGLDTNSANRIARYTPGLVVAVNTADFYKAAGTIAEGQFDCNTCFFAVLIVVDPDKEEVVGIYGMGISDTEAQEIARRMGITLGSKWSVEMIMLWLMGMFMK